MAYQVRAYIPTQDKEAVVAIMNDVWGFSSVARFLAHYDWQQDYKQRIAPYPNEDVVIEKDGIVVGYVRLINVFYKLGEHIVEATNVAEIVTHSQHRGSGIKLFRYVVQENKALKVGIPIERAGELWEKISKRPISIRVVKRNVLMLKPSVFLHKKRVPFTFGKVVDFFWKLKFFWIKNDQFLGGHSTLTLSCKAEKPSEQEYTELMDAFSYSFYAIALRNYSYFCWRFFELPGHTYQYLWLREAGKLVGYCIYRECLLNGRTLLLIVDIVAVAEQKDIYKEMIRKLIQIAWDKKYADIQVIETGCDALSSVLKKVGAVSKVENESLLAYIPSEQSYASEMYENKKWYMSLADGDYEFVMYPCMESKSE